ncbi:MAG TPA: HEAT repeat domain-containing protein [Thermoanaerobaculia bacterium]|nr:HEAT repeat domain-containing protein [Thermoanaerobaculia bacterium]
MRKLLLGFVAVALSCTTATPPPSTSTTPATTTTADVASPYGFTVEEEARILQLEDRREFDPQFVADWVKHPNALHRVRIALALARIGPYTFIDRNNNGVADLGEPQAGVAELATLASDPDRNVREMAAFALGEIGDLDGVRTLFFLTGDADAGVAAEAAEALSKFAQFKVFAEQQFAHYSWMTRANWPEGVRARTIRYLFRFNSDEASALAADALADSSAVIRREAAYALSRRGYEPAAQKLELLLTDPDVLTRAYAAAALGRIAAKSSAAPLLAAIGDVHPWVRTNAVVALSRVEEKTPETVKVEDLPRIVAVLEDPDPGVRANAIDLLRNYAVVNETARKRLFDIMNLGTAWERDLAIVAIVKNTDVTRGRIAAEGVPVDNAGTVASYYVDYARRLMARPTPWGKAQLLEATGKLTPMVLANFFDDPNPTVRAAAFGALQDRLVDSYIDAVRKALSDPDVIVRASAVERYGSATVDNDDTIIRRLLEVEQKERSAEQNDARIAAIRAIADFDDPRPVPFLRSLISDKDPVVRQVAAELLESKRGLSRPQYTPLPITRTPGEYAEIVRWSRQPHTATIHMTRGIIELALLTQDAPMTTWNFAQLAKKKYFDNSSFMRVVPNFVVQGGDPRNDMNGGPGYAIRDEINLQKYTRGAVGMALSGPDTGGSQFFITYSPQPHLDGGYTIFARVYEGMNGVVDQVERGDRVETITIDEHPPVGGAMPDTSGAAATPFPLQVGPMTAEKILQVVPEYGARKSSYAPDASVVEMMKTYVKPGDRVEVYMGTWCPDSAREVPKFLRVVDDLKMQYGVDLPVTYFALDRSKAKPENLVRGKSIQKLSTFIYYRGNRELGRIVERPVAVFEDDLLALAAKQ